MSDTLNICLPCGFCCDGTLVGYVALDSEELPVLTELMDIEGTNDNGFFLQPCKNLCGGCAIYSKRPKQCASFKCGLLNSFEEKELDFDSAMEIINVVKQKKIAIEKKLEVLQLNLKSQSFHFKMVELKKISKKKKSEASLTQEHIELMSELEQLDSLVLQKFGVSLS